jgi:protein-S-isoprenylcysteine O-methyltransferase Ste14
MKASNFEFRFRVWIMAALITLGFWAPWIEYLPDWMHLGTRTTAWLWLGFELGSLGLTPTSGIVLATALMIAVAALAVWVRVWGTAYLGNFTVQNAEMKAGAVLSDGPFRHVRNPLYIGTFLTIGSICVLMPISGAVMTIVLLTIFLVRLILGEEAFLAPRLGEPYAAYLKAVPRIIPSLRPRVAASGRKPQWGNAVLGEILPIGVLVSFAALSWQYDSHLLMRAVLISFGVSLVTRAFVSKPASNSGPSHAGAA